MKWYVVYCDVCGWESPPIDEVAAKKFMALKHCQNCKEAKREVEFKFRETVNFFQGGH